MNEIDHKLTMAQKWTNYEIKILIADEKELENWLIGRGLLNKSAKCRKCGYSLLYSYTHRGIAGATDWRILVLRPSLIKGTGLLRGLITPSKDMNTASEAFHD